MNFATQIAGSELQTDVNTLDQNPLSQTNDVRQMQQQWASNPSQQSGITDRSQHYSGSGGQVQGLNANVLMSAFQQAAPQGQMPRQGAENILASMLAAANSNSTNQTVPVMLTTVPQLAADQSQQSTAGLQGLEHLANLNPAALQQASVQQQNQQPVQTQTLNGLQGIQQQIATFQQHFGTNQQQILQQEAPQPQQQQQQSLQFQQSSQNTQISQPPFLAQPQNSQLQQQQIPTWMGQNLSHANIAMTSGLQGADQNSLPQQEAFMNQLQVLQGGQAMSIPNMGLAGGSSAFQFVPQVAEDSLGESIQPLSEALRTKIAEESNSRRSKKQKKVVDKRRKARSFPEKLMQAMVEHADENAVAWLPDGKSFVIVNPDLFCDAILNKVFKESKYASFVRKLHRWGFVRLTSGTGTDCFHHPQFQRNKRDMAGRISCATRSEKEKDTRSSSKPPSLAGVEKFIRAKVVAAAASAAGHS